MVIPAANLQEVPAFALYVRTLQPLRRKTGIAGSPTSPRLLNAYNRFIPRSMNAVRENVIRTNAEARTALILMQSKNPSTIATC